MSDHNIIAFIAVTLIWALIGAGGPFLVPKGLNRGIIQTCIVLTSVCCYLFWLLCFLHQLNPLFGPELTVTSLRWMNHTWGPSGRMEPNK